MTVSHALAAPIPTFDEIRATSELLDGVALRTPNERSPAICAIAGAEVVLKMEHRQFTNSFKMRGASRQSAPSGPARSTRASSPRAHARDCPPRAWSWRRRWNFARLPCDIAPIDRYGVEA
jgi:hypothetical protein